MKVTNIRIIFTLSLCVFSFNLFAQTDSLYNEFKDTPKTSKNILKLIELTNSISNYNADSALSCAYKIQKIKIASNKFELQTKVLTTLGTITKLNGKYNKASSYFIQALAKAEKQNLTSLQVIILYQIGDLNRAIGLLNESLKYLYLSRNLSYKHKLNHKYPEIYNRLSATYFQLTTHNFEKFEIINIPNQEDIGKGKNTPEEYIKLCKIYADSAIIYAKQNKNINIELSSLNLLGAYFRYKKQYAKAISKFNSAIEVSKQNNFKTDVPNYYANIAKTFFEKQNYKKAIEYGLKGYEMAEELNILAYKSILAYNLRISYMKTKDFEKALHFYIIEVNTRSLIYDNQKWNKISELDKKYQNEKKQKEIEHQKEIIDLKDTEVIRLNTIIIIMLVIFIIIAIGVIYIQKQKKKINIQAVKITEQYHNLKELDLFKKSLTQTLVHDLKNPLGQILNKTNNQDIRNSSNKMLKLIMNLLDVEKYEESQLVLNKKIFPLSELLQELEKTHTISLKEKNLTLNFPNTDYLITADKEILSRVFDNLLSNAIRFSPLNKNINILAENKNNNRILITIKNFGENIPHEELPYIFDKFQHFGKNNNSSYRSTGLGLTFCKMVIVAHGEEINVHNETDGVIFSFTIEGNIAQEKQIIKKQKPELTLSQEDIKLLNPFLQKLKKLEVFQISKIIEILNQIPDKTATIIEFKNEINNTVYVLNIELYEKLINQHTK